MCCCVDVAIGIVDVVDFVDVVDIVFAIGVVDFF